MPPQIIVVDDDPIVGSLSLDLLIDAGFSALLINDSKSAQEEIKRLQPSLVVLDILMPGIDGLTLLHRLKSDPATKDIHAIVVSGKSFGAEKARALQFGAELFIEKPYNVETFSAQIAELLKSAPKIAPPPLAIVPNRAIQISIWGCRAPSADVFPVSPLYGKNTSCVAVELPEGMLIFDAGSGLVPLGDELAQTRKHMDLWLFLTHFHRDHVEGLSRFACARDEKFTLHIAGANEPDKTLDTMVAQAFEPGFRDEAPPCRLTLYELIEETYEIMPGVRVTAFFSNHPGTTLGFILQTESKKIVYCPDSEVYGEAATALQDYDEKLGGLIRDADLLIHDGRYTDADYQSNRNTGHSSFTAAIDLAGHNHVKHLVLVHQDGRYSDDDLDQMGQAAQERLNARGYKMTVALGREGLRLAV